MTVCVQRMTMPACMGVADTTAMFEDQFLQGAVNTTDSTEFQLESIKAAINTYNRTIIILSIACIIAPIFIALLCWLHSKWPLRRLIRATGDSLSDSGDFNQDRFAPPDYDSAVNGSSGSSAVSVTLSDEESSSVGPSNFTSGDCNELGALPSYSDVVDKRYTQIRFPRVLESQTSSVQMMDTITPPSTSFAAPPTYSEATGS